MLNLTNESNKITDHFVEQKKPENINSQALVF